MPYPFQKTEKKWRRLWRQSKIYEPNLQKAKKPFYNLMMFPYPSAEGLHVGNMYAFTGSDIYGRFQRMRGYDVFEPIGLDGFGIHSENYALKIGVHPQKQARISEKRYYEQLENIGNGFAREERLETYNENYYRWTQWIFVKLFEAGLVYRKTQANNWCPQCKTVLADEQVIEEKCERCGAVVEKKELEQWFFKITKYAEKLLKNLENLDWSEKVKIAQKNWIGKSEGVEFEMEIAGSNKKIKIYTTRLDTVFGMTYVAIAPEHSLIQELKLQIKNWDEVEKYILEAQKKSDLQRIAETKEKTGVELKGIKIVNPFTKKIIPLFVADYVLVHYGTGVVMAVPAHDERDYKFAKKKELEIKWVIKPVIKKEISGVGIILECKDGDIVLQKRDQKTNRYPGRIAPFGGGLDKKENIVGCAIRELKEELNLDIENCELTEIGDFASHFEKNKAIRMFYLKGVDSAFIKLAEGEGIKKITYDGALENEKVTDFTKEVIRFLRSAFIEDGVLINSENFNDLSSNQAREKIVEWLRKEKIGWRKINYKMRDWLISRQRYWGAPIPLIFCESCRETHKTDRTNRSYRIYKSNLGELENLGWFAVPEKDLPVKLPFLKEFRPLGKGESPLAAESKFYNTKCPRCGGSARRETDVSDTFLDSAWYYLRYPNVKNQKEGWNKNLIRKWCPVDMYIGGVEHAVLHLLYSRFLAMALEDLRLLHFEEPFKKFRTHGLIIKEGAKMSKSKGNVVNPDEYLKKFGADALRMYLMFLSPFEQGGDFRDKGILGITRFLDRIWNFFRDFKNFQPLSKQKRDENLRRLTHQTAKKITADIENLRYNTAISSLMVLFNGLEARKENVAVEDLEFFLKLLAPFAPYIAEEIWHSFLSRKNFIHLEFWPRWQERFLREEKYDLVVQINGKVRGKIVVDDGLTEKEILKLVLATEQLKSWLVGKKIKKTFLAPGRLINVVVD